MHIFQLVKTLRAKINLGEWDRVRWSGQWQHKGSFFREGLSYSDVWAKNERVGAAIPRTSGEKCLRWKTQVQKLWWEGSLHLRDSKRTGPMKANSERKLTKAFFLRSFISSFSKNLLSICYVVGLCLAQGIQWWKQPENAIHLCHLFSHSKCVWKPREKSATFLMRRRKRLAFLVAQQ